MRFTAISSVISGVSGLLGINATLGQIEPVNDVVIWNQIVNGLSEIALSKIKEDER